MPKNTKLPREEKVEAAAVAFNAAQDAAIPAEHDAKVVNGLVMVLEAVEAADKAVAKVKAFVRAFILECALAGETLANVKALCVTDTSWPKDDHGNPVGEKAARKTRAGDAYNSIQAVWSKLVTSADGVPIVETDTKTGDRSLVTKGKNGKLTVEGFTTPEAPAESQLVTDWQSIRDAMTAEQWDIFRPLFAKVGCPVEHIVSLAKVA